MDQQSQQRVNEAADKFTEALVQSYKAVAERGASSQEQSAQLTEVFFDQTVNNLRAQAEETHQAALRSAALPYPVLPVSFEPGDFRTLMGLP